VRGQPAAGDAVAGPAGDQRDLSTERDIVRGVTARRRSTAKLIFSPAAAPSSSTRCAPGWSPIRAIICDRATKRTRTARPTRWSATMPPIARWVTGRKHDSRRIGRCSEPRSTRRSSTRCAPRPTAAGYSATRAPSARSPKRSADAWRRCPRVAHQSFEPTSGNLVYSDPNCPNCPRIRR